MKRLLSIICICALLLSTSSLSYFYWLEEKIHESKIFAQIDKEEWQIKEHQNIISLVVDNKEILPEGYEWEEEGREFSHQGMFYDIISVQKTNKGWIIKAASDEEEAVMVAAKTKAQIKDQQAHKKSKNFKIHISKIVFHHDFENIIVTLCIDHKKFFDFSQSESQIYLGSTSPPPKLAIV